MDTDVKKRAWLDANAQGEDDWDYVVFSFFPYKGIVAKALMLLIFYLSVDKMIDLYQAGDTNIEAWLRYSVFLLAPILYLWSLVTPWERGKRLVWFVDLCFVLPLVGKLLLWEIGRWQ